jgi:hypothetical protein
MRRQVLSETKEDGSPGRIRTSDHLVNSRLLATELPGNAATGYHKRPPAGSEDRAGGKSHAEASPPPSPPLHGLHL